MHSDSLHGDSPRRRLFGRRTYLRMGLMSGAVLAGLAAGGCAWRDSGRPHWGGWRHGGWADDPAAAKEHARQMARWALKAVDATDEQQTRADAIVSRLADDLQPLAEAHRVNHDAMAAAFTGAVVDRQAIETARQSDLELAAKAYTRVTDAFAEIAEVLTPEQRTELATAIHRHRRWH